MHVIGSVLIFFFQILIESTILFPFHLRIIRERRVKLHVTENEADVLNNSLYAVLEAGEFSDVRGSLQKFCD